MFLKLVEAFCAHQLFELAGQGRGVIVGRQGWLLRSRPVLGSAIRHGRKERSTGGRLNGTHSRMNLATEAHKVMRGGGKERDDWGVIRGEGE